MTRPSHVTGPPRSAIVIPHHDQSGYVVEALSCAMAQRTSVVVVVDDASSPPHRSALLQATRLVCGHNVTVVQRASNGGLSAARNTGIDWVLRHHPSIEFVLPLDADDLIEGTTISRLEAAFDSMDDPSIGWLYGDGTLFGTFEAMARMPRRFTHFRLRQHNLCFSASFIHRRIFDAGLRYDETLINGFEDWEFYLQASELGFRGVHIGDYGFHYRKHGISMLAGSRLRAEETYLDIMARHPASFERREMGLAEHAELPRFAVLDIDRGELEYFSSPDLPPHRVVDVADALGGYSPPIVILARADWLDEVRNQRLWHQALSLTQMALRNEAYLLLGWHHDQRPHVVGLAAKETTATPAGIAFSATHAWAPASKLLALLDDSLPRSAVRMFGPIVSHPPRPRRVPHDAELERRLNAVMAPDTAAPQFSRWDEIALTDRAFAFNHSVSQLRQVEMRHRHEGTQNVGVILPWVGLGGMDLILLALSSVLATNPRNHVHLLSSENGILEISEEFASCFATINPTPPLPDREQAVRAFMEDMDVLLLANSDAAIRLLPAVRSRTAPTTLVFIQNVELTRDRVSAGWLYPLARQYDASIDGYVVPSRHTADQIAGFGVAAHKVLVVPNAPIYRPPSGWDLEQSTESKKHGLPERPLRILYAGRFDRQKGMDRLGRILKGLEHHGIPVQARLVGRVVLEGEPTPRGPSVTVEPPTFDAQSMRELFEWADCLVLPSRWEGLPLVMLDAMVFGVPVITTDVGGIPEYVSDGEECVLVEDELGDAHVIGRFVDTLVKLHKSPHFLDGVRLRAHRWASGLTWPSILEQIETAFPMMANTTR